MDYTIYKLVHILGILMVFSALGGIVVQMVNSTAKEYAFKKQAAITHGIGMFLILLGGFGMLARLGINWPWDGWVFAKIIIWIIAGGASTMVVKMADKARAMWWFLIFLGTLAGYFAIFKPF